MTLVADSQGVVLGKFTIPASVTAGTKEARFAGAGGSSASARFSGEGTLLTSLRQLVTQITTTWWGNRTDPLAQTFTLTESMQVEGVELWFTVKGTTTVSVQIRETQVGFPTQTVLAEGRLTPAQVTAGQWNHFQFDQPARLEAGTEYAIVALCNDATAELAVAELGKFDTAAQQWVTQQPYSVGVMLASSNASTWTAFQDRDLAFRLIARRYTETSHLVDLGSVSLTAATDLLVLTLVDMPTSAATAEIELTMPDGSVVKTSDGQRVSLAAATTGTVGVKARLHADDRSSAAIYPGTQIVQGQVLTSATYVTRAIDADAAGVTVKVLYDAIIPSGAGVTVEVSGVDAGDTWQTVPADGTPKLLNNDTGLYEYRFKKLSVAEAFVRVRLTLTGTTTARPRVRNLRVFVL